MCRWGCLGEDAKTSRCSSSPPGGRAALPGSQRHSRGEAELGDKPGLRSGESVDGRAWGCGASGRVGGGHSRTCGGSVCTKRVLECSQQAASP